jgi:2-dehydro-3-deoxyphosphogluconate aldolase / (4S)-4-hydroxy-2-oxoglutarate aldolase
MVSRQEVRRRIEQVGIIPSVRASSMEDAMFAAEAVWRGGIPIVEITLTVPEANKAISQLARNAPDLVVGAGGVFDVEAARLALEAGAQFLTSDGLDQDTVRYAVGEGVAVIPGAFTPTDVIAAWKLTPDFVKVVPCANVGGDSYIRSLKAMFPGVPLIAAGGVNQQTATNFILAGAIALGIGAELIPREAIRMRQADRIAELARRFIGFVNHGRGALIPAAESFV